MTTRIPAEVFPPGDFLREELEARGWTQADLARLFRSAGIDAIQLRTDREYARELTRFFDARERRRRHG